MDLRTVHSFVTVVEEGSLAGAARRLNLTAAAIAARVHALEDELGAPLIRRAGRAVKPTQAGLRILDTAAGLLRDARHLRATALADAHENEATGEIRIGSFVSARTGLVPPVLKALYAQYPNIQVWLTSGSSVALPQQVHDGALDLAFVVEPQFALGKTCQWQCLLEEPLVMVAPEHLAGGDVRKPDALALLRTQPYICYDRSVLGGQLAERYLRDCGIVPRQRLEIDGLMTVAHLVAQGLGVALLPDWQPMWQAGLPIARVPLPGRAPVRRVGVVWAKYGPRAFLAERVVALAAEMFGSAGKRASKPADKP